MWMSQKFCDKPTDREYDWRLEYSKMYETIQNHIFGFILKIAKPRFQNQNWTLVRQGTVIFVSCAKPRRT